MIRFILLSVLFGLAAINGAYARAPSVEVIEPRPFGYFLGDTLRREVDVRLGAGQELEAASLPRPGPLNYWLELSSVDVKKETGDADALYRISLTYQTFYAPLDPRRLLIPSFKLKISGAAGDGEVTVPELSFLTSPIRQLFTEKNEPAGSAIALRPDRFPPRQPTGAERTTLLLSAAVALAALVALAWHNAWWPFHRRPSRPFTEAARYLMGSATRLGDARDYREALLRMHRAFDHVAGRRVLADDVGQFLANHPEFAPYAREVEQMFASSRQAFFADDLEKARATMPLRALTELSARLGAAERSAA